MCDATLVSLIAKRNFIFGRSFKRFSSRDKIFLIGKKDPGCIGEE